MASRPSLRWFLTLPLGLACSEPAPLAPALVAGQAGAGGSAQAGTGTTGGAGTAPGGSAGGGGVSGTSVQKICLAGTVQACTGEGQCAGEQRCQPGGTDWTRCQCLPGGGAGAPAVGAGPNSPPALWVTALDAQVSPMDMSSPAPTTGGLWLGTPVLDTQGNIFLHGFAYGLIAGSVDVGDTSTLVVMKLDATGHLLWLRPLPEVSPLSVKLAVDATGNVLLTVCTPGTPDTDPFPLGSIPQNMSVLSLSSADGSTRWSRPFPPGVGSAPAISISPTTGSAVLVGWIESTVDLGLGPVTGPTMFEMHLDDLGATRLVRTYGGKAGAWIRHRPSGNLVLAGSVVDGTMIAGEGATPISNEENSWHLVHNFLAEITPEGVNVTARTLDVPFGVGGLGFGLEGNLLMAGDRSYKSTDFGGGPGEDGAFLVSYSVDGVWQWERRGFGASTLAEYTLSGLAVLPSGDILLTSTAAGKVDLGAGPFVRHGGILARYAPGGAYVKASLYDHTSFFSVTVAPDGNPIVVGTYEPGADFGQGPLTTSGGFIAKLSP